MNIITIFNAVEPIKELNSAKLNINTTLKLLDITDKLDKVLKVFEEKKKGILEQGLSEEENIQAINLLAEEDVDIDFEKIPLSELKELQISANDLQATLWLIDKDA